MDKKIEKIYKQLFIQFLKDNIDFYEYEKQIQESDLYFSPSKKNIKNIDSIYYSILNDFYIENLSETYQKVILQEGNNDAKKLEIIKKTYKEVLKKGEYEYVMYNPPMPSHRVLNGSLVFEFSYGKNDKSFSDEEYLNLSKKQREFINNLNKQLKNEIKSKLGLECAIFVEKRM